MHDVRVIIICIYAPRKTRPNNKPSLKHGDILWNLLCYVFYTGRTYCIATIVKLHKYTFEYFGQFLNWNLTLSIEWSFIFTLILCRLFIRNQDNILSASGSVIKQYDYSQVLSAESFNNRILVLLSLSLFSLDDETTSSTKEFISSTINHHSSSYVIKMSTKKMPLNTSKIRVEWMTTFHSISQNRICTFSFAISHQICRHIRLK